MRSSTATAGFSFDLSRSSIHSLIKFPSVSLPLSSLLQSYTDTQYKHEISKSHLRTSEARSHYLSQAQHGIQVEQVLIDWFFPSNPERDQENSRRKVSLSHSLPVLLTCHDSSLSRLFVRLACV